MLWGPTIRKQRIIRVKILLYEKLKKNKFVTQDLFDVTQHHIVIQHPRIMKSFNVYQNINDGN